MPLFSGRTVSRLADKSLLGQWSSRFELMWACRTHRHDFFTKLASKQSAVMLTQSKAPMTPLVRQMCQLFSYISDPVILLTNKSDLSHFSAICMLGVHFLRQLNTGTLFFNFLVSIKLRFFMTAGIHPEGKVR